MPDEQTLREAKLAQYLVEAHGKEKELETALQAHIKIAQKATYKKRLQEHLRETKAQSKALEKRIKALGGPPDGWVPDPVVDVAAAGNAAANKAVSMVKGVGHALRGQGVAEKQLKNAKTELWNEHEEIANYLAIEALAEALDDKETAKLARDHRKQEERMAAFLEKVIPQLTKDVVKEEIPAAQRKAPTNGGSSRGRGGSSSRGSSAGTSRSRSASAGSTTKRSSSASSRSGGTTKRASSTAKRSSGTSSRSSSGAKRSGSSGRSSGGSSSSS
ncbi:MAG TPA: DUF892 family protein [Baekduia sp.]|nr:DUF892 family protein [Baekduia sp.]